MYCARSNFASGNRTPDILGCCLLRKDAREVGHLGFEQRCVHQTTMLKSSCSHAVAPLHQSIRRKRKEARIRICVRSASEDQDMINQAFGGLVSPENLVRDNLVCEECTSAMLCVQIYGCLGRDEYRRMCGFSSCVLDLRFWIVEVHVNSSLRSRAICIVLKREPP